MAEAGTLVPPVEVQQGVSLQAPASGRRAFGAVAKDYYDISKPRILYLLLIVAWSAMAVASRGLPPWRPFLAVTLAGAFSVASSGAFNHVLERGRDARMARTATRPIASGRLSPTAGLVYGFVTAALAYASLAVAGLQVAALLTLGAIAYYVLVYTVVLKPSTPQNIVIGGLAGSFPALIGWSAATGGLAWPASLPAWALALLVFLWTPAHFWALALLYKEDYGAADYPMMPNVRGEASTRRQVVAYSALTVACSTSLVFSGSAGWVYLMVAALLGALLLMRSVRMMAEPSPKAYRGFFLFTIQYLGVLLLALIVDQAARFPVA
ncbi:MAG TPA: heme o synthase [Candidatus Thermoplasmatota archaeon]|nr:heme o synthase [Candidatus Thermoplasmatota archaeon]